MEYSCNRLCCLSRHKRSTEFSLNLNHRPNNNHPPSFSCPAIARHIFKASLGSMGLVHGIMFPRINTSRPMACGASGCSPSKSKSDCAGKSSRSSSDASESELAGVRMTRQAGRLLAAQQAAQQEAAANRRRRHLQGGRSHRADFIGSPPSTLRRSARIARIGSGPVGGRISAGAYRRHQLAAGLVAAGASGGTSSVTGASSARRRNCHGPGAVGTQLRRSPRLRVRRL